MLGDTFLGLQQFRLMMPRQWKSLTARGHGRTPPSSCLFYITTLAFLIDVFLYLGGYMALFCMMFAGCLVDLLLLLLTWPCSLCCAKDDERSKCARLYLGRLGRCSRMLAPHAEGCSCAPRFDSSFADAR
jgi:hypothetical protein